MTDYASRLRAATNTWSVAYLSFQTGHLREEYRAYVFVEDEDDMTFYQVALTAYDDLRYLGCGGRSGVLALYKKLFSEDKSSGCLFL